MNSAALLTAFVGTPPQVVVFVITYGAAMTFMVFCMLRMRRR